MGGQRENTGDGPDWILGVQNTIFEFFRRLFDGQMLKTGRRVNGAEV